MRGIEASLPSPEGLLKVTQCQDVGRLEHWRSLRSRPTANGTAGCFQPANCLVHMAGVSDREKRPAEPLGGARYPDGPSAPARVLERAVQAPAYPAPLGSAWRLAGAASMTSRTNPFAALSKQASIARTGT